MWVDVVLPTIGNEASMIKQSSVRADVGINEDGAPKDSKVASHFRSISFGGSILCLHSASNAPVPFPWLVSYKRAKQKQLWRRSLKVVR